jgi:GT2 family glycosyltransferase
MTNAVTAVICAYTEERWADIEEAVASLRRQTMPPARILLVIDHNAAMLARARLGFDGIDVVENAGVRGLSGGRNTGIALSETPFVAFLDDDAVAGERFLEALTDECRRPDVLGATARVEPIWLDGAPRWLPQAFFWTVGCTYMAPGAVRRDVRNVSGGASVFRREVFSAVGGFSSTLGRDGGSLPLSCEETELCIRASRHFPGGRFVHRDDVSVGHKVSGARLTLRYFLRRCFAEGVSKYRLSILHSRIGALQAERAYLFDVLRHTLVGGSNSSTAHRKSFASSAASILGLTAAGTGYVSEFFLARLRSRQISRTGSAAHR